MARAVQSLLTQDFRGPIEVLVVDDGSTDGSGRLAIPDTRVRVIRQENAGSSAARLTGIRSARARYVAFLDSDDVACPGYLSRLHGAVTREPAAVLAFGRMGKLNRPRAFDYEVARQMADAGGVIRDPFLMLVRYGCVALGMNLLVSRRVALESAEGRQHVRAATDYDFVLRCARFGAFAFVDETTVLWDLRTDGISRRSGPYQAAFTVLCPVEAVMESDRRDDRVLKGYLRDRVEKIWPWAALQLVRAGDWSLATKVARVGLRVGRLLPSIRRAYWALTWRRTSGPQPVDAR